MEKLTLITYDYHPRRAKKLLDLVRDIDPTATPSGGNGYGIIITEASPSQCEAILGEYLESGVIRNIL
jgi:hypothetical protein